MALKLRYSYIPNPNTPTETHKEMSEIRHRGKSKPGNISASDGDDSDIGTEGKGGSETPIVSPKEPVTFQKVFVRSAAAVAMGTFVYLIVRAGHLYCILLAVAIQTELYRELVNVRYVEAKQRAMPWFRTLQWSWFLVAMCGVYGESTHKFCAEHRQLIQFTTITRNFSTITYAAYCMTFIITVLTLKPGLLRFQISQFMWSIVTICLTVFQSKFFATNALNGLFWFVFPTATVVANDVSAYFVGISFGRRFITAPFLSLSPNKTWEGFIGAAFFTIAFSFIVPGLLASQPWFTCPAEELFLTPFPPPLDCVPNSVFTDTFSATLPYLGEVSALQIQVHGLAFGLFASLVAPFGGFFASAIKRAYKKKDFDSIVPGHGGIMDRMDCQLLIFAFTSFYYSTYIAPAPSFARMEFLVSTMRPDDQVKLYHLVKEIICLC